MFSQNPASFLGIATAFLALFIPVVALAAPLTCDIDITNPVAGQTATIDITCAGPFDFEIWINDELVDSGFAIGDVSVDHLIPASASGGILTVVVNYPGGPHQKSEDIE